MQKEQDFKLLVSIDMGVINIGISVFKIVDNILDEIRVRKLTWKIWKKDHLLNLITYFNLSPQTTTICIEFQMFKNKEMIKRMYYSQGFFESLGYTVNLLKPITSNLKLPSRKERKQYSVDTINNLFSTKFKYKDHDMTDSMYLGYNYLLKNNIKNAEVLRIKLKK